MEWIKRAWRGEERLWKVFWIYGVLGRLVFAIFTGMMTAILALSGALSISGTLAAILVLHTIYDIWCIVSQWRCAFNANSAVWGYIVRVLVVLEVLGLIANIAFTLFFHDHLGKNGLPTAATFTSAPAATSDSTDTGIVHSTHAEKCLEKMTEYAKQKGYDPVKYASQNEAWLQQCTSYLDAAGKPSR